MWSRVDEKRIQWKESNRTEVYDEAGLRFTLRNFLTNESRARYGGDNFCQDEDYFKALRWFMDGMKLFDIPSTH